MNHRSALVAASLLSSLSACAPSSVRPIDDGGGGAEASADSASPSLCAAPIALLDASSTEVDRVVFARAGNAFVMVTSVPSGALQAQAFDERWQRAGSPITLRSTPSNTRFALDEPSAHFEGARGAIAYGSTVHEVSIDGARQLASVRTMSLTGSNASVLGAWPRTDEAGQQRLTVVASDTSVWNAFREGLTRSFAPSTELTLSQASALLHPFEDRYLSYERVARRDINNDVRVRQFTVGHGAVLPVAERLDTGSLLGEPVALVDRVLRLHYRVGSAGTSNWFGLVQDQRDDGVELSRSALDEDSRVLDGAIAIPPGSARLEDLLLVWTRLGNGAPTQSSLVAQRGANGTPFLLHDSTQNLALYGAWLDGAGARGWVVYGEFEQSAMPRRRLFARCIER